MLTIANDRLRNEVGCGCLAQDVRRLHAFLERQGTFEFPALETGLFAAARLGGDALYTGYDNVWVRDNIHVAHAHLVTGQPGIAVRTVRALSDYFRKYRHRFETIIRGEADPADPMNRPHIRFNGTTLTENDEKWSHAQNDALGYFLWLACRLNLSGQMAPSPECWDLLGLFPLYFKAVEYWQDEDSGHWEEARKIEASSIGAVIAGLREMRHLMDAQSHTAFACFGETVSIPMIDELIAAGMSALCATLPYECVQSDPVKQRRYDSALLFLIYPLRVVDDELADQILEDVSTHLLGDHGVRRYLGDSFWCADYKTLQSPETRTSDVSDDMTARDALLKPGQEAQWCIFDPLLSVIYGRRYRATKDGAFLRKQLDHLSRSLNQLTGPESGFPEFLCPELYYLAQGRYVPNDVTPLLWTQANLRIALSQMERNAESVL